MTPEPVDQDYYAILGVRHTATAEQIKHAFRSKAKLLHPDRNRSADATDEFIRLGEAYRVLRDEEKRLIFDDHWATVAPPAMCRRPAGRAAAGMVALVVSIGAASTFGYLALSGGPPTLVAEPASARPVPLASATAALLPLAKEHGLRVSDGRGTGDPDEDHLRHMPHPAPSPLVRPGPMNPPRSALGAPGPASPLPTPGPPPIKSGAGSFAASGKGIAPPPETDENLVASLSDSVDAPFAAPQTASVAKPAPQDDSSRVSEPAALKAQEAAAAVVPPQRVDHRLAQQVGTAAKPTAVVAAARPATPLKAVVRAAARPSYQVRAMRPYRVVYPPYPRANVRRTPVTRYQTPQWAAPAAPADDWPF